jgi:hypothetical protein
MASRRGIVPFKVSCAGVLWNGREMVANMRHEPTIDVSRMLVTRFVFLLALLGAALSSLVCCF